MSGDWMCGCCGQWMIGDQKHGVGRCVPPPIYGSVSPPLDLTSWKISDPRDVEAFFKAHGEWSEATFGNSVERGPTGPLKHMAKEIEECLADPTDLMEFADLFLLLCDSTRRAGFTFDQLREAAWTKLEICKKRTWPKVGPNDAVEHVHLEGENKL